eukprot:scaffold43058_cov23-Tisochrysis_lutea.AAC.1
MVPPACMLRSKTEFIFSICDQSPPSRSPRRTLVERGFLPTHWTALSADHTIGKLETSACGSLSIFPDGPGCGARG